MDGIVVQGSVGFVTFECFRCRKTRLEIKDSSEVVQAYLGQTVLVCQDCLKKEVVK